VRPLIKNWEKTKNYLLLAGRERVVVFRAGSEFTDGRDRIMCGIQDNLGNLITYKRYYADTGIPDQLQTDMTNPEEIAWADATAKQVAREKLYNQTRYIRFGDIPKSGYSVNYATNTPENGISVYKQIRDLTTGKWTMTTGDLGTFIYGLDRPVFIVDGDEIGVGSDGESLLGNVRVIRKIATPYSE
jgi:hypothetical protein